MTYCLLGRTGDLCAVLPFLKQETERPRIVVSNQHSQLFEGVSYVDVVEWGEGIHTLLKAWHWAKMQFGEVKSLQVIGSREMVKEATYGPAGAESARTTSFVKEMWRCAGKLDKWDECWPLVFDRRNPERELKLLDEVNPPRKGRPKKLMLVFTESHSSPFPYKNLLSELLKLQFAKTHNIVFNPKAERFYDLLGLMESADVMVTVDTAPLHLARAVPNLRVVALTNDSPILWNGSPWMPNHIWYSRYTDFPNRAFDMVERIRSAELPPISPAIVCVTHRGLENGYRWNGGGEWVSLPIFDGMTGRDSQTSLGDEKRFPYLKDCLRMGLQKARDNDIVMLARAGTGFSNPVAVMTHESCFSYRMEDNGNDLTFAPVVDMFAAKKKWWKERLPEIPDYLFGRDHYWSNGMVGMFRKYKSADLTGLTTRAKAQA
jgi:hypothetical protein